MSDDRTVEFDTEGGVAVLRLRNEQRRNAVSASMWKRIGEVAAGLRAREDLRVVLIRGHGEEAFSAGADISEFAEQRESPEATRAYDTLVEEACRRVESIPVPTVAMIHGYCIGGGLSLAASCDLRVCDERATFAIPAARLGLGYDMHGVERLLHLLGPGHTLEILYTARPIHARRALAIGLVHHVAGPQALPGYVDELLAALCANAPLSLRAVKACVRELLKPPAERDVDACLRLVERANRSEDYREGRTAFAQKRDPVFRGR